MLSNGSNVGMCFKIRTCLALKLYYSEKQRNKCPWSYRSVLKHFCYLKNVTYKRQLNSLVHAVFNILHLTVYIWKFSGSTAPRPPAASWSKCFSCFTSFSFVTVCCYCFSCCGFQTAKTMDQFWLKHRKISVYSSASQCTLLFWRWRCATIDSI